MNASCTDTSPLATRWRESRRETDRWWVAAVTVKVPELVAVPPGVATVILPVVAPEGTFAVILLEELTVKVALKPLNLTDVAPLRFEPLIVTEVPTGPLVGENDEIVGTPVTVNVPELVSVPPGVVTLIFPVVAPEGTFAVILLDELTVNVVALTPLNLTAVAPVKLDPLIVTEVPTGPLFGENPEIVGAAGVVTVKFPELVSVPPGVVTLIFPVVAPEGTVAVILLPEFTVKEADVPLNLTAVAPVKFEPLIVTEVPTGPLVGENPEMFGTGAGADVTVKSPELVAVPSGVVTLTGPVVAPDGTVAVILVPEITV